MGEPARLALQRPSQLENQSGVGVEMNLNT